MAVPPRSTPLAVVAVVCLATIHPGRAEAGGFSVTQFGSRRTGMLANMGAPDEATALFHNPAGLADQHGWRLHLSSSMVFADSKFKLVALDPTRFPEIDANEWPVGSDGHYERIIEPLSTMGFLPYVGASRDLGAVNLRDVVISVAVTAPNVYAGTLPESGPSSYFFIEGYFVVLSTIVGAGWRINDKISVGANVMYNYMRLSYAQRYSMADALRGRDNSGNAALADAAQLILGDLRLDYTGVDHGFGWTLSLLYSPTSWLSIGAAYNDATDARFEGDVELSSYLQSKEGLDTVVKAFHYRLPTGLIVEMPIPPFISFGVNLHASRYFEVGADVRLWLYQVYKQQVLEPIYDTEEGEAPFTKENLTRDKDYGLSYDVSLGVMVRPLPGRLPALELMAGGGFDKTPVPAENFTIDNPALDNWRVSTGVRYRFSCGLRVAATYIYLGYIERVITDSAQWPPLNGRGFGSSHTPRLELEYHF
jgi:long-chain fatty acid transport protein